MKFKKRRKEKPYKDKYYETRRAAFRGAKRDNGIPVSREPNEVISPNDKNWQEYNLDKTRNRRLYRFVIYLLNLITGFSEEKEIHIREDKDFSYGSADGLGDQTEHFNSGEEPDLKRHHYFKRRNRK